MKLFALPNKRLEWSWPEAASPPGQHLNHNVSQRPQWGRFRSVVTGRKRPKAVVENVALTPCNGTWLAVRLFAFREHC
jgi:hypothetical protein